MSALDHSASSSTSAHLPAAVGLPDASPSAVAAPASGDPEGRLERLGDRIAELSARLQATTWELLALIPAVSVGPRSSCASNSPRRITCIRPMPFSFLHAGERR